MKSRRLIESLGKARKNLEYRGHKSLTDERSQKD